MISSCFQRCVNHPPLFLPILRLNFGDEGGVADPEGLLEIRLVGFNLENREEIEKHVLQATS